MKKTYYAAIIGGFFMLLGVFFACKEGVNPETPTAISEMLAKDSSFVKIFVSLGTTYKRFERAKSSCNTQEAKTLFDSQLQLLVSKAENNSLGEEDLKIWAKMVGYESYETMLAVSNERTKLLNDLFSKYPALLEYDDNQKKILFADAISKVKVLSSSSDLTKLQTRNNEYVDPFDNNDWGSSAGCRDINGHKTARRNALDAYLVSSFGCLRMLTIPVYGEIAAPACEIYVTITFNRALDLAYDTYCK